MHSLRPLVLTALLLTPCGVSAAAFAQGEPAGDARAAAQHLAGTGAFAFDTRAATLDGGPTPDCTADPIRSDVWFRWEASASGPYSVSTCAGAEFDTVIVVYAGDASDPAQAPIACNDQACGAQSLVRFEATQGAVYDLRIGGMFAEGAGTFRIHSLAPGGVPFCTAGANSLSTTGSQISMTGTTRISANDMVLRVSNLPAGSPGLFYFGEEATQLPFGDGFRCVGGRTLRFPATFADGSGHVAFEADYHAYPANQLGIGLTRYFQFWYRDATGPRGTGFNQSNGLELTFLP